MNVIKTDIEGLVILVPKIFEDERGYFFESYTDKKFKEIVGDTNFVQENESYSKFGVLRGLHFQKGEYSQAKLVRVVKGRVLDVAVDLRPNSPTYGKYVSVELSDHNKRQLFIPRNFAHGFIVLSNEAIFQYKCDNYYFPSAEGGIKWNDPELAIDWKLPHSSILVSEKDHQFPLLSLCKEIS
jgi:dTDP-4-dehydrorhamnose 3,5-epimerase